MKTKNFRNWLCALVSQGTLREYNSSRYEICYPNFVDTSGKRRYDAPVGDGHGLFAGVLTVGTGTTPPTEDDYKLENKVDLKWFNQMPIWHDTSFILVGSFTNNTSEAVTITEVAYQLRYNADFIISRDLITPITIPAGETRTIQYTIEF